VWCGVGWGGGRKVKGWNVQKGGGWVWVYRERKGLGDVCVLELNGKGVGLMLWCLWLSLVYV
jgi:hypothetical protein